MVIVGRDRPGEPHRVLEDYSVVTGLGRDRGADGRLHPASIQRTLTVLGLYRRRLDLMDVSQVVAGATAAVRGTPEREAFLAEVRGRTGLEVRVLSGEQEAATSFAAAHREFGGRGALSLVDIGGGSTELAHGRNGQLLARRSVDLGAVRCTEDHLGSRVPPRAADREALGATVRQAFQDFDAPEDVGDLVAVAGTATTLVAVRDGITPYDGERVHGQTLTAQDLVALEGRMASLSLAEITALPGMEHGRGPYAVAGTRILRAVFAHLGVESATVGDRGLRYGLLYCAHARLQIL
jgi:exopolyphosphatase/guanosine-5'-triphosphate,3'-diphosphate pyrophosphatase